MSFNIIDLDNWNRKPYFEHYLNAVRCTYSMTCNIDITNFLSIIKSKNIKLYPILIYVIMRVINNNEEFRTCFDENGVLGYWDEMNPSYTIFHEYDNTFSDIWTVYSEDFNKFYKAIKLDMEEYKDLKGLFPKANCPPNSVPISCIPWASFTGFNLNIFQDGRYLLPITTIGKYFNQDNKILLPISLQVHHAVADGYHTTKFINEIQELIFHSTQWINVD